MPIAMSVSRTTASPAAGCLRLAVIQRTAVLGFRSVDQVDGREQANPHDIDEVPVIGDDDRADLLLLGKALGRVGAPEQEDERDQAAGDVQPVESGGQEEDRPVVGGLQRYPVPDQGEVFVALAADE